VGRPGLDLWRLLVFAIVKQCLDLDYDALLYRANNDLLLRELLGMARRALMRSSTRGNDWSTTCSC
jgi:hypothetical protein